MIVRYIAIVYSFGMIIYELMTLREPYDDCVSMGEMSNKIENGIHPTIPDSIRSDDKHPYHPFFEIFRHCTDVDPDKRPTMEDLMLIFQEMPVDPIETVTVSFAAPPTAAASIEQQPPATHEASEQQQAPLAGSQETTLVASEVAEPTTTTTTTTTTPPSTESTAGEAVAVAVAQPSSESASISSSESPRTSPTVSTDAADSPGPIHLSRSLAIHNISKKHADPCPTVRPVSPPGSPPRGRRPTLANLPAPLPAPVPALAAPIADASTPPTAKAKLTSLALPLERVSSFGDSRSSTPLSSSTAGSPTTMEAPRQLGDVARTPTEPIRDSPKTSSTSSPTALTDENASSDLPLDTPRNAQQQQQQPQSPTNTSE